MKTEHRITFEPSGRTVYVLAGTRVFEAAARAGLLLQTPCGGKGTCGKCRVRIMRGTCEATAACRKHFTAKQVAQGYRLACQASIQGECVIEIPATSLYESRSKILTHGHGRRVDGKATVQKTHVELPVPTSHDAVSDLDRLERVLGPVRAGIDMVREFPELLRRNGFRGTTVVCAGELLAFEPGNTESAGYGVAFDLGTTTIVAVLIDLVRREERGVAAELNPQIGFGDDVISRVNRVRENPAALRELQEVVVGCMNTLIAQLLREAGVARDRVYEITVAGNTTMQHLFCGISPAALGEVPFPPVYRCALHLGAHELGLAIHPRGKVYVFPNIGGFVGGDTVAGILANAVHESPGPALLVDIGTNGEIVLAHKGKLRAASTAAGPAFEGARIAAGMRATDGAVEKVVMNGDDIVCNVIGNARPVGLCGTALIDVAAELLRLGVLDSTGRVLPVAELPAGVPGPIRARLHERNGQVDFLLFAAGETKTGDPIYLCQKDLRELQLATGAIRAGINIILKHEGLAPEDLAEVMLAGGFGNFIRRSNARRIGLLPPIPCDRIRFVGNASSMGAKFALLSGECRTVADKIAASVEHVDLSLDPDFQMEFGSAMMFPESEPDDHSSCP